MVALDLTVTEDGSPANAITSPHLVLRLSLSEPVSPTSV